MEGDGLHDSQCMGLCGTDCRLHLRKICMDMILSITAWLHAVDTLAVMYVHWCPNIMKPSLVAIFVGQANQQMMQLHFCHDYNYDAIC